VFSPKVTTVAALPEGWRPKFGDFRDIMPVRAVVMPVDFVVETAHGPKAGKTGWWLMGPDQDGDWDCEPPERFESAYVPFNPDGFTIQSAVATENGIAPVVFFHWGEHSSRLRPSDAARTALWILEACAAAAHDAMLIEFVTRELHLDETSCTAFLELARAYRQRARKDGE